MSVVRDTLIFVSIRMGSLVINKRSRVQFFTQENQVNVHQVLEKNKILRLID